MINSVMPEWMELLTKVDSRGIYRFGDLGDIFGSFFGGGFGSGFGGSSRRQSNQPRQGQDRYMQMRIDFMDAIFGKTETISLEVDETCKHCNGSGAEVQAMFRHVLHVMVLVMS